MNVIWTVEAEETFNQNINYLLKEWNGAVVIRFIDDTAKAILSIEKNPALYPFISKKKKIRRCPVVKQVSFVYRADDSNIELITFWNNYQNPKKLKLK